MYSIDSTLLICQLDCQYPIPINDIIRISLYPLLYCAFAYDFAQVLKCTLRFFVFLLSYGYCLSFTHTFLIKATCVTLLNGKCDCMVCCKISLCWVWSPWGIFSLNHNDKKTESFSLQKCKDNEKSH
jgi:hypothetical protein